MYNRALMLLTRVQAASIRSVIPTPACRDNHLNVDLEQLTDIEHQDNFTELEAVQFKKYCFGLKVFLFLFASFFRYKNPRM